MTSLDCGKISGMYIEEWCREGECKGVVEREDGE